MPVNIGSGYAGLRMGPKCPLGQRNPLVEKGPSVAAEIHSRSNPPSPLALLPVPRTHGAGVGGRWGWIYPVLAGSTGTNLVHAGGMPRAAPPRHDPPPDVRISEMILRPQVSRPWTCLRISIDISAESGNPGGIVETLGTPAELAE